MRIWKFIEKPVSEQVHGHTTYLLFNLQVISNRHMSKISIRPTNRKFHIRLSLLTSWMIARKLSQQRNLKDKGTNKKGEYSNGWNPKLAYEDVMHIKLLSLLSIWKRLQKHKLPDRYLMARQTTEALGRPTDWLVDKWLAMARE